MPENKGILTYATVCSGIECMSAAVAPLGFLGRNRHAQHLMARHRLFPGGQEALPIGLPLGDARLLEDDLREPDGIRIVRLPPGQITTILTEPF